MQVVDHGTSLTTTTYSGTATVLNESSSALGAGWTVAGLEQITSASGGVILNAGRRRRDASGSPQLGRRRQRYTSPAGDFSTLAAVGSGGGWTRTLTDGTEDHLQLLGL